MFQEQPTGMFKKVRPARPQPFGARSVLPVREHGKKVRTPLAAFFNIPYEEDQPNLEGTNNRGGTKQYR
jgi:hypothetical protein